jgi:hypothetical protein
VQQWVTLHQRVEGDRGRMQDEQPDQQPVPAPPRVIGKRAPARQRMP